MQSLLAVPDGTPVGIDCAFSDITRAARFYHALFGWQFAATDPAQTGGMAISFAHPDDDPETFIAGFGVPTAPAPPRPQPCRWSIALQSSDIHAHCDRAVDLGGRIILPPTPIGAYGTLSRLVDPTGASFSLWQPGTFTGFRSSSEPGRVDFCELFTEKMPRAVDFYVPLFELDTESYYEAHSGYTTFTKDGVFLASVMKRSVTLVDVPRSAWMPYFTVAEIGAACSEVLSAGGEVLRGPYRIACGQVALVTGPEGELFHLLQQPHGAN